MTELQIEDDLSLRANIFGFSLEKLHSLLGSGDLDLLGRLSLQLRERESDLDTPDETIEKGLAALERAIRKGVPFAELVAEGDAHLLAAITLAMHDQELTATNSESWQATAFWALEQQLGVELEPEPRLLLRFFCEGRPLFGKIMETERNYYGYLSFDEVKALQLDMTDLEEHIKDWEDVATLEFVRDLAGWLNTIAEAEQDLWFYVR